MNAQWLQASGFGAIVLMPVLLPGGAAIGRPELAFGVAILVFPLARLLLGAVPQELPEWREDVATWLQRLPVLYAPVLVAGVGISAWLLLREPGSAGAAVGYGLSLWMTMLFATCVAHELFHRRDRRQATLGHVLAGFCGYPLLGVEHLAHHARPGDTARVECPRVNESVWGFAGRRLRRILAEFLGPQALVWSRSTTQLGIVRLRLALMTTVATAVAVAVLAGWRGLVVYAAVAVGVAFGVQLITYLQHWGLGADHLGERVAYGRGWEEDCRFQAWITLNISLHDGHHRDSRLPYYRLGMTPDSPRLPASYVLLMFASLVPPLWFAIMKPALAHWVRSPTSPLSAGRRLTCFGLYPR
jgi:alkane 1-monooxygenase